MNADVLHVLDNLEALEPRQVAELTGFLLRLHPKSGTMALLTLRPDHRPPLLDQMKTQLYRLPVTALDPAAAIALLGEILKLPAERDATEQERRPWEKIPSGPASAALEQASLEACGIPEEKIGALDELARAAYHHPFLVHLAAADLAMPENDWLQILERLKELRGKDLQEKVADMIGKMCDDLLRRDSQALDLLKSLLIFSGGATPEALSFVWGVRKNTDKRRSDHFENVRRTARGASLLEFNGGRYELHPLVQQYLSRSRPPGARNRYKWSLAHATYFRDYAARMGRNHDELEREKLNLMLAMDWAGNAGKDRILVDLTSRLFDFLWTRGFWNEGLKRMKQGLLAAKRLKDTWGEADMLHGLGVFSSELGNLQGAKQHLRQALELRKKLRDSRWQAAVLSSLGFVARKQGNYQEARRWLERSLVLWQKPPVRTRSRRRVRPLLSAARTFDQDRLSSKERISNQVWMGWALLQLGMLHKELQDPVRAERYYEESRKVFEQSRNVRGKAFTLREFGDLQRDRQQWHQARAYYHESLALFEAILDRSGKASSTYKLAKIERLQGNFKEAEALHRRSLSLAEEIGSMLWKGHNLLGLHLCAAALGQHHEANPLRQQAEAVFRELKMPVPKS